MARIRETFAREYDAVHALRRARSRGVAYVLVLSISMLVGIIGASAISIVRAQLRATTVSNDTADARLYALSAIELTKQWCYADPTWRTDGTKPAGGDAAMRIGGGTFTVSNVDPIDGNIANSPLDPLVVTATGFKGNARQLIQCTLAPARVGYSCLGGAVTARGNLNVDFGNLTVGGAPAVSNWNITLAANATLDGDAVATGQCIGNGYLGNAIAGAAARVLPGASVFDYYIVNGTAISYAATGGQMKNAKLSFSNNPYGAANAKGIYVVDCGGQTMKLDKVTMTGTLVLLNAKSDSTIENKSTLTSATPAMPALMVQGSITCNGGDITGLVYVSGNFVSNADKQAITGCLVVGGAMTVAADLAVTWDGSYLANPPPGFFDPPPMKVVAGSWKQVVN